MHALRPRVEAWSHGRVESGALDGAEARHDLEGMPEEIRESFVDVVERDRTSTGAEVVRPSATLLGGPVAGRFVSSMPPSNTGSRGSAYGSRTSEGPEAAPQQAPGRPTAGRKGDTVPSFVRPPTDPARSPSNEPARTSPPNP